MAQEHYFRGITEFLKTSIHPEITHFRNGRHPGKDWYLKTVCPMPNLVQIDQIGYGFTWYSLSEENPESIKIIPHAYDWNGTAIPYMASVWLHIDCDVIITLGDKAGFNVILVDRSVGNEYYINTLYQIIEQCREESKEFEDYDIDVLNELDEIEKITEVLDQTTKSENAIQIRKDLKILDGGLNED